MHYKAMGGNFSCVLLMALCLPATAVAQDRCSHHESASAIGVDLVSAIDLSSRGRIRRGHLDSPLRASCSGRNGSVCRRARSGLDPVGESTSLQSPGLRYLAWVNAYVSHHRNNGDRYTPLMEHSLRKATRALSRRTQDLVACYIQAQGSGNGYEPAVVTAVAEAMANPRSHTAGSGGNESIDYSAEARQISMMMRSSPVPSATDDETRALDHAGMNRITGRNIFAVPTGGSSSAGGSSGDEAADDDAGVRY